MNILGFIGGPGQQPKPTIIAVSNKIYMKRKKNFKIVNILHCGKIEKTLNIEKHYINSSK